MRTCQTLQILPIVAKTSAVLLSKLSVSCELSALTVRGLATLDFFSWRSPLGLELELEQLLWDTQSLQQDRRVIVGSSH